MIALCSNAIQEPIVYKRIDGPYLALSSYNSQSYNQALS